MSQKVALFCNFIIAYFLLKITSVYKYINFSIKKLNIVLQLTATWGGGPAM